MLPAPPAPSKHLLVTLSQTDKEGLVKPFRSLENVVKGSESEGDISPKGYFSRPGCCMNAIRIEDLFCGPD